MTRDEHLDWCRKRALEHLDAGDLTHAVASMASDLKTHPDTENPALTAVDRTFSMTEAVLGPCRQLTSPTTSFMR